MPEITDPFAPLNDAFPEQEETVDTTLNETSEEEIAATAPLVLDNAPLSNEEKPSLFEHMEGLNEEELSDPNRIAVTIADKAVPLVVFFGPPSCGKTMTMVRLTRYLNSLGYNVAPVRTFRPSFDANYKRLCDNFNQIINQDDAHAATNRMNFMLVEVVKDGRRLCQFLEAPGEGYFDPAHPQHAFPAYVNSIINSNNRKIYCAFVEPDWKDQSDRSNYAQRIGMLKSQMSTKDRTIFVFNKIDQTNYVISRGKVHTREAQKGIDQLYPGIFAPFREHRPLISFIKPWNCRFIPFQTGTYTQDAAGNYTYQQGPDEYPRNLWNAIMNSIKG